MENRKVRSAYPTGLPAPPHLRALFVQYPGKPVHPVWADRCERWETIEPEQGERLAGVMGRLIG